MSKIDDGGAAFPGECGNRPDDPRRGMSLRQWYAGQALVGILSGDVLQELNSAVKRSLVTNAESGSVLRDAIAASAFNFADAMLAADALTAARRAVGRG